MVIDLLYRIPFDLILPELGGRRPSRTAHLLDFRLDPVGARGTLERQPQGGGVDRARAEDVDADAPVPSRSRIQERTNWRIAAFEPP